MGCCIAPNTSLLPVSSCRTCPTEPSENTQSPNIVLKPETFVRKYHGRLEGKYRLGRLLGSGENYTGTFGNAFEAVHLASGTTRAVKIINRGLIPEVIFGDSLPEVSLLQALDHPHILKVYEVIVETDFINVVCELCSGGELLSWLQRTKITSETTIASLMRQLLSAVAYCHEHNIVHRDLKPANVLLETDSQYSLLKIIDFGAAVRIDASGKLSEMRGSVPFTQPFYSAPEVLVGNYDEKSDIWSCGIILVQMLARSHTKENDVLIEKLNSGQISTEALLSSLHCSDEGKNFLRHVLSLDPRRRPSARQLLCHPWIACGPPLIKDSEIANRVRNFSCGKLKQAALMYIALQLISLQETDAIRRKFIEMDTDGDGVLCMDDLYSSYDVMDAFKVMTDCNSSRNGRLRYSEFLTAAINWTRALCDSRIDATFSAFDYDCDGLIHLQEIQMLFSGPSGDRSNFAWSELMRESGMQGDGALTLKEFKALLRRSSSPDSPASTASE